MRESISGRFGEKASRYTQIALPRHPALEDVVALAAPQERNISFSSAERMVNDSRDWLGPQYSSKFSALSRQDLDFIDSLIGIRNYLAHQSTSAGRVMNKALGKLGKSAAYRDLGRGTKKVRNIGAFLKSWSTASGLPRIITYCETAGIIAGKVRP